MKKLLILFCTILVGLHGEAQSTFISAESGITHSNLKGGRVLHLMDNSYKTSVSYGLSVQHYFKPWLGVSTGAYYLNIGTSLIDRPGDGLSDINAEIDVNTNIRYINFPLCLNLSVLNNQRLYVKAGVYISVLFQAYLKGSVTGSGAYWETFYDYDYMESFNKLDAGIVAGIGSNIPLTEKFGVNTEFNFSYGLRDVNAEDIFEEDKLSNIYFSAMIGVYYKLETSD